MNEILLIGKGRLAQNLSQYLTLTKRPFCTWDRSQAQDSLKKKLQCSKAVFLAISDSALESFFKENKNTSSIWFHFSGSMQVAGVSNFHPLMTFTHKLRELEFYENIPFISFENDLLVVEVFQNIFPKNPLFHVPEKDKAIYHALCVMGGNFSTILMEKMKLEFSKRWKLPATVIEPYLKQIVESALYEENPLTGPLQRKDRNSIQRNMHSLKGDSFEDIYKSFLKLKVPEYNSLASEEKAIDL